MEAALFLGSRPAQKNSMKFTISDYSGERYWEWDSNSALVIGRSNQCELSVETDGASRKHCRIWLENQQYFIEDLGSRNGTLINGKPVTKNELHPGDRIQVGRAKIFFGDVPPRPRINETTLAIPASPPPKTAISLVYLTIAAIIAISISLLLAQTGIFSEKKQPLVPDQSDPEARTTGTDTANPTPNSKLPTNKPDANAVAARTWERLRDQIDDADQLRQSYRDFIAGYSGSEAAAQAQARLRFLEKWQNYQEERRFQSLAAEVASLISLKKFAAAAYLTRFYQSKAATPEQIRRYQNLYYQIANQATAHYHDVVRQATRLERQNDQRGASELYLENLPTWTPFAFYSQALQQIKKLALPVSQSDELHAPARKQIPPGTDKSQHSQPAKPPRDKQASLDTVKELLKHYHYRQAQAEMERLLRQKAGDAMAESYREFARWLTPQRQLFEFLLARISRQRLQLQLTDGITGVVTSATRNEFTVRVNGADAESRASLRESWERLQPQQLIALYEQLPLLAEHKLGLAIFCWDSDNRDKAWPLFIEVYQQAPVFKSTIEAFLGNRLRIKVPAEGLIVAAGRLTTREQDSVVRQQRQAHKLQAKRIQESLQAEKQQNRAQYYYQKAVALQNAGYYQDGRKLFAAIANKFPQMDVARKAAAKATDPLLRIKPILVSGPSSNRLDIYIMGDGYTIKESHQENFDDLAYRTAKSFIKSEPFREYQSYLNFHQMNIASHERGCDIVPGTTKKDTALGAVCRYDFMRVDQQLVKKFLARAENNDGQVIVFANGGGGGATGGNGIIAAPPGKFSLLAHEFGHSFGRLGDEYSFSVGVSAIGSASESKKKRFGFKKIDGRWVRVQDVPTRVIAPNLLAGSNRKELLEICPWKHWLKDFNNWKPRGMHKVGLF